MDYLIQLEDAIIAKYKAALFDLVKEYILDYPDDLNDYNNRFEYVDGGLEFLHFETQKVSIVQLGKRYEVETIIETIFGEEDSGGELIQWYRICFCVNQEYKNFELIEIGVDYGR